MFQEIDDTTAECLALEDDANILEGQLAHLQLDPDLRIEALVTEAAEKPVCILDFTSPDIIPAMMDIKAFYHELADRLQLLGKPAVTWDSQDGIAEYPGLPDSMRDSIRAKDPKAVIADLENEIASLQRRREELERLTIEKETDYAMETSGCEEEIAELRGKLSSLKHEMKLQIMDYEKLINAKMALDIEIAAYRVYIEEENDRMGHL
ncbi:vimentin-like [Protopterus annectens]|uniref:vimentin-like n=1 Tax=Protopterus annectens TaxID=7888 RepID=UPI001CFABA66|nr:vimentin-like [Protopterus annectens]